MTDETRKWVTELTSTERNWTAARIAAWVQRGWSFLGVSREDYEKEKAEIIHLVQILRG